MSSKGISLMIKGVVDAALPKSLMKLDESIRDISNDLTRMNATSKKISAARKLTEDIKALESEVMSNKKEFFLLEKQIDSNSKSLLKAKQKEKEYAASLDQTNKRIKERKILSNSLAQEINRISKKIDKEKQSILNLNTSDLNWQKKIDHKTQKIGEGTPSQQKSRLSSIDSYKGKILENEKKRVKANRSILDLKESIQRLERYKNQVDSNTSLDSKKDRLLKEREKTEKKILDLKSDPARRNISQLAKDIELSSSKIERKNDRLKDLNSELQKASVNTRNLSSEERKYSQRVEEGRKRFGREQDKKDELFRAKERKQSRLEAKMGMFDVAAIVGMSALSLFSPAKFEDTMQYAVGIADSNDGIKPGKHTGNMNYFDKHKLQRVASDAAANSTFSQVDTAETIKSFAQSGYGSEAIKAVLEPTLTGAHANRTTPQKFQILMRNTFASQNITPQELVEKEGIGKLSALSNYYMDLITRATKNSPADIDDYINWSFYSQSSPFLVGLSPAEHFGILSMIGHSSAGTSTGGTGYNQLLERMYQRGDQIKEKLGVDVWRRDEYGEFKSKDLITIVGELKKAVKNDKTRLEVLSKIFDTEASRPLNVLMNKYELLQKEIKLNRELKEKYDNPNEFDPNHKDYNPAKKTLADRFSEIRDMTVWSQFLYVFSDFTKFMYSVFNASKKDIHSVTNTIRGFLQSASTFIDEGGLFPDKTGKFAVTGKDIARYSIAGIGTFLGGVVVQKISSLILAVISKVSEATNIPLQKAFKGYISGITSQKGKKNHWIDGLVQEAFNTSDASVSPHETSQKKPKKGGYFSNFFGGKKSAPSSIKSFSAISSMGSVAKSLDIATLTKLAAAAFAGYFAYRQFSDNKPNKSDQVLSAIDKSKAVAKTIIQGSNLNFNITVNADYRADDIAQKIKNELSEYFNNFGSPLYDRQSSLGF